MFSLPEMIHSLPSEQVAIEETSPHMPAPLSILAVPSRVKRFLLLDPMFLMTLQKLRLYVHQSVSSSKGEIMFYISMILKCLDITGIL